MAFQAIQNRPPVRQNIAVINFEIMLNRFKTLSLLWQQSSGLTNCIPVKYSIAINTLYQFCNIQLLQLFWQVTINLVTHGYVNLLKQLNHFVFIYDLLEKVYHPPCHLHVQKHGQFDCEFLPNLLICRLRKQFLKHCLYKLQI